ncbi:MAG: hypothetical protein WD557_08380 [Dehalococcoidia bacterium]
MKILGLTDSNAVGGNSPIAEDKLRDRLIAAPLSKALGEEVEITSRIAWPNADLPRAVEGWLDRLEPDVLLITTNSFAYQYRSAPIKLERKYGAAGRLAATAGLRMAATPRISHNRPFQWARKQIQRRVGGATHFEPEEVAAVYLEIARIALRHEGLTLGIVGPTTIQRRWATTGAELAEAERRRLVVHNAFKSFCHERHVWYRGSDLPQESMETDKERQGDELHANEAGHRRHAEIGMKIVVELCRHAQQSRGRQ